MTITNKSTSKRAKPPVKVACLACRASRIRCDGNTICANCSSKDQICVYTKSNRGGPRVSRKKAAQHAQSQRQQEQQEFLPFPDNTQMDFGNPSASFQGSFDDIFSDIVMPMISPGAGLRRMSLDSDQIFDSIFGHPETDLASEGSDAQDSVVPESLPKCVLMPRMYGSDKEILNAYYIYIHPFYPVLPPPESVVTLDNPSTNETHNFEPSSPLSLAISAILSLIPNFDDISPKSQDSILLRRKQAHLFAQLAMESIEIESEILASITSPADALGGKPSSFKRDPFHPNTPVELESILAYLLLSNYEYAQRGNLAKMRNRASQALDAATRLSLQDDIAGVSDIYREAKRRAWWMTYACVLQTSIVSSTAPIMDIDRQSFPTPFPETRSDIGAWKAFIAAQQMIWKCTQYTISLKQTMESGRNPSTLDIRMTTLDRELNSLIGDQYINTDQLYDNVVDSDERVLAKSLRVQAHIKLQSAKIKLHRYRAFQNAPLFTQKHCDLEEINSLAINTPSCCSGSSPIQQLSPSSRRFRRASSTSISEASSPDDLPLNDIPSMKICLKSALTISKLFDSLPYPSPMQGLEGSPLSFLYSNAGIQMPRTMPAFACCAMQSSYALLMLCQKGRNMNRSSFNGNLAATGLGELYSGIQRVLNALENYAIAFEAIDGMRAQIQEALEAASLDHGAM